MMLYARLHTPGWVRQDLNPGPFPRIAVPLSSTLSLLP